MPRLITNCQIITPLHDVVHGSSNSLLLYSRPRRRHHHNSSPSSELRRIVLQQIGLRVAETSNTWNSWNRKSVVVPPCNNSINIINNNINSYIGSSNRSSYLYTKRRNTILVYRCLSTTNVPSSTTKNDSSSSSSEDSNPASGFNISMPKVERLQSATGRARKRRRRIAIRNQQQQQQKGENDQEQTSKSSDEQTTTTTKSNANNVFTYPKGRPWLVLWPDPYKDDPNSIRPKYKRTIPRINDIRTAWSMYMETWEDGLRGPKTIKNNNNNNSTDDGYDDDDDDDDFTAIKQQNQKKEYGTSSSTKKNKKEKKQKQSTTINIDTKKEMEENFKSNIKVAKDTSQQILQHAKDTTGIKDTRDLKKVAEDIMQLVTDCLKEFMSGYKKGRDDEIDNMLNEYFKEEEGSGNNDSKKLKRKRRKRRKPKRGFTTT